MPTGTSTIFGVFQAILALLVKPDGFRPRKINYCGTKSSPVKSFVMAAYLFMLRRKTIHIFVRRGAKTKPDQ
jgi:hypothetical protein